MGGDMDVAALATLAGNALVTAAVTDFFEDVRGRVARLFGRGKADAGTERRLDATQTQLTSAAPGELERVRTTVAAQWQTRFTDLLDEYPDAEPELRALVADIEARLPAGTVAATDHSIAAGRDINIGASGGGVAAGVIHGNVSAPDPSSPGPANG